ncbi:MAG: sulfotransferase [Gammaproteobacteria bacterium]|nr:sulfotransferase [Gammaproteobacteria bacterium]
MPRNIIVVGTPRSGTSLAASIFARLGHFVADDEAAQLRDPDHFNPGGYWEAEPLIEANVSLFRRVGFEHHNTWIFDPINPEQAGRISSLPPADEDRDLVARFEAHRPWVWKDPRLCYTLGYWWPLVDQDNTAVLFVRRDPEETFKSFARIGWRESNEAGRKETYQRMAGHIAAAEAAIRDLGIPHVEISYSEYRESPDHVATVLSDLSGIRVSVGDLGFTESYSSSTLGGRLRVAAEKAVKVIPLPVRNAIRRLMPKSVLEKLFPGR